MRQKIMERIGAEGCYFLCLVHAAEGVIGKRIDAVEVYESAVNLGLMHEDCYLVNPARIMELMTGHRWSNRHDSRTYQPKPGDVLVMRYERKTTAKTFTHFVLMDHEGGIAYDPLGDSVTVRLGQSVSSRVFVRHV
jgi:hypothetical protein